MTGTLPRTNSSPGSQPADLKKQLMNLPIFRKANEALGAQIWHVDDEFNPVAPPRPTANPNPEDDPDEI